MDSLASETRPRKRRAINACVACRASKVKCDGERPCQRCALNRVTCQDHESSKDATTIRLEGLETELHALREGLMVLQHQAASPTPVQSLPGTTTASFPSDEVSPPVVIFPPTLSAIESRQTERNAVERGHVSWLEATLCFFLGSHLLVPIFCEKIDTLHSVAARSAFLFDAITSVGCRCEEGFSSAKYHRLQSRLREHLTSSLIGVTKPAQLETIQAIAVMASYSENGSTLIAIALRFALELGILDAADRLFAEMSKRERSSNVSVREKELYRITRVWYGICNLEMFFSLDGGKQPGIEVETSSRRIRALANHPERTLVDMRLYSQVELNMIRSSAYRSMAQLSGSSTGSNDDTLFRSTVRNTILELGLWLNEWVAIISADAGASQRSLALLNLQIQYEWALITLHLKALSDSGVENIAVMDDFQQGLVVSAKEAAVRHLGLLLRASSSPPSPTAASSNIPFEQNSAYLTTFKWTMDYVWAKCAYSVLLVLKLALLLREPPSNLMLFLRDAHKVLEELKKITVGNILYFQILQTSIEKCESALKEYIATQQANLENITAAQEDMGLARARPAETDFQGYTPSEFVFEWDFPGLNLRHMPLSWQDLFIDFDNVF
ncbi:hypothetical protein BCR34DRAFT_588795 [Clohesyomyces aquaticus]|uniref:Zn(2)-C6 fungal-type domain-containing protein n=1 Tax=Clohesyomyces aquaticus TaxID=1231657 RepID=A0A1Y1ZIW9_9PLEO|nr:hypothetical protein BCR34DRAFT_588795 [Clohesyomyces aquaticus]